jgi:hypothetical protein
MKVGIAGFGLAGEVFHAPLVAAVDGLEVAGIVTTHAERTARTSRSRWRRSSATSRWWWTSRWRRASRRPSSCWPPAGA